MKQRRFVLDTTLRDGEQAPGVCFTGTRKVEIAGLLDACGVYQIEAGAPAVSYAEKQCISRIIQNRGKSVISVWARLNPADIAHCIDIRPDIIHISIPVSYPHIYIKLRKDKDWVENQLLACIKQIQKSGIAMSAGFEDAFRADTPFMAYIAQVLLKAGVTRIRLSDTTGTAYPALIRDVIGNFTGDKAELGFHGHNDLGLAAANTIEALKTGCLYADVTIGGIGERAGNCDLAKLISAGSGLFDFGIDPAAAEQLQNEVFNITRR